MLFVKEINLLQAQNEGLKKQNAALQKGNAELKAENELLKAENKILLGQLVINDGEDVTVQISESQFDEYNKYRTCLQEIKAIAECVIDNDNSLKTDHCFGYCDECSSFKHCKLYPYWQITRLITKAESEG